jgi:hypothetical protein
MILSKVNKEKCKQSQAPMHLLSAVAVEITSQKNGRGEYNPLFVEVIVNSTKQKS